MQVGDAQYMDAVIPMYNLTKYSDNYSKTSGILWQYCRDEPALDDDGAVTDFTEANGTTDSLKIKEKITGQTGNNGTEYFEIMVLLKYLSNFWTNLEMF